MEISSLCWTSENTRKNSKLLPKSIRGLIIGKSGCGKTTVLLNLLLNPGYLDYTHLYIFSKSLHQPEYKIIKKAFDSGLDKSAIVNIFRLNKEINKEGLSVDEVINQIACSLREKNKNKAFQSGGIISEYFSEAQDVPSPQELNSSNLNLCVFDDVMLTKQSAIEDYYCRGRHNNVDSIYLSQSYFKLPRQTIRENSNLILLFPQDEKNIAHIHRDHVSQDMTLEEFKNFCRTVWKSGNHNFVTLDLTSSVNDGKYRKNLDEFYFFN